MLDNGWYSWFAPLVAGGEFLIGVALILGAFVGIAATGALLMNMSFLLAGTASTNPVLAAVAVLLILAWKNAGYIGVDRFLLPALGTPWGRIGERETEAERRPRRPVGRGSALAHH
jgi:thiosulfate dehydrogenase [quinone] large subunit